MRRALRILALTIVGLVALVAVGLATPPGHSIIAGIIERAASGNGLTVSIGRLSGWPPFWLGADRITLADADGPFAEIDGAEINIRTLALLTGNLAFDAIDIARVSVSRSPRLPGGGSGGALLPFAADAVNVARLELGEALAGHPAVLAVKGSVASGANGSLAARLDAARIDGGTGRLAADIERTDAASLPILAIDLNEAADGILPGLMGRATAPGYALTARTSQSDGALAGTATLSSEGAAHFDGRFTLTELKENDASGTNGGARRIMLTGNGDLAELVPPAWADLLSGPIEVSADADFTAIEGHALPAITIRAGSLTTATVKASATGALGGNANAGANANLALHVDVAKSGGGPIALPFLATPARLNRLALNGTVAPSADKSALRLQLAGTVAGLAVGDTTVPGIGLSLAVEAQGDDPLASTTLPYALRVEADAVETPSGRIVASAAAPIVLSADGTYDVASARADTKADLAIAGGHAAYAGTVAADGANGRTDIAFADLAPLSPLAGRSLAGSLKASANGAFPGTLTIEGTATDLDPGDATAARLLAGAVTFAATVADQDGALAISSLTVNGDALTARGGVTLAADTIEGNFDGSLADLARLADQSSGAATFSAKVSGARTRPDVDATIAIPSGTLLRQSVTNATVHLTGAPSDTGWAGTLALDGAFAGKPLAGKATARFATASGLLELPSVDLLVGDNRITGAVARTAQGPLSGRLNVDAPNLATLAAFALVEATGAGDADIQFAPDGARQSVAVSFSGTGLATGNLSAAKVDGEVHIDDAFGAPLIRGNASASRLAIGSFRLDTASATASVTNGATTFDATVRGPDVALSGTGRLAGASGAQTVTLDTLTGTAYQLPVRLSQPVSLALGGGQSRISGARLALGGGEARIDGATSPDLDLTVTLTNVAASLANTFVPPLGAQGTISGRATIKGPAANPAIAWQADWSGASVAATRNARLPGLALTAGGNATLNATSLTARLTGAGLALDISGTVPYAGAGLDVRATGTAPLSLIALESAREIRAAGTARVNLALTGALNAIATSGTVDLADATLADTDTGFGVAGASGRIAFTGRQATIQQFSGHLAQGGDIAASGTVDIAADGLPANLKLRVTNGRYADGSLINTTFNADLAVTGPLTGNGVVSGTVDLGRTEIQLPDRFGGAATAIDVKHVNAAPGFTPPKLRQSTASAGGSAGSGGLRLDIALSGNRGLFVRGFGIDSELGGTVRIGGTTGNPQAAGAFTQRRGRIEVLGRRFDFQSGTLTFSGDLIPVVDFAATTTTSDGTVTLNVTGPANDPKITFTSSPALPQEEILSRLLFNQEVGKLSPLQAAQLVDAVAQLTGALGGTGLFARVRQATGLDDLDVRQSATGGTTVGVSKRINDNVRLGVEAGTDANAGRVVIDLDLTKNLKARGEAGQDGSGKLGITYEREY
jgi:translocation and assembly module TamB